MTEQAHQAGPPPRLVVADVTVGYAAVDGAEPLVVLRNLSLSLESGASLAVVGPSGSGKSTLLNVIGALAPPTTGTVRFDGDDLYTRSEPELAAFRNRSLGFIFQSHHLLPQCSALENVLVPVVAHPDGDVRRRAPERARGLLEHVGLGDRLAHRPGQLSGGECQRVAVARALINEPKLILADEPTGSLDEEAADQLAELLTGLSLANDSALVVVTHSMRLAGRMQRGLALRQGRLEPWTAPATPPPPAMA